MGKFPFKKFHSTNLLESFCMASWDQTILKNRFKILNYTSIENGRMRSGFALRMRHQETHWCIVVMCLPGCTSLREDPWKFSRMIWWWAFSVSYILLLAETCVISSSDHLSYTQTTKISWMGEMNWQQIEVVEYRKKNLVFYIHLLPLSVFFSVSFHSITISIECRIK